MRRFELVEGSSKKFWSVDLQGKNLRLAWGRIGTAGQEQTKPYANPAMAERAAAALVVSKVKKGYVEVKAKAKAKAASVARVVDVTRTKLAALVPACFEVDREFDRCTNNGTSWLDEESMANFLGAPCSDADIEALEVSLGRPIPASYRAYLSLFGNKKSFEFPLGAKQHGSKHVKAALAEASALFDEFGRGKNPIKDGAIPFQLDDTRCRLFFVPPMKNGEMAVVTYEICEEIERFPNLVAYFEVARKRALAAVSQARRVKAKMGVRTHEEAIALVIGSANKASSTDLAAALKILGGRLPSGEVPLDATIESLTDRTQAERFVAALRALDPFPEVLARRLAASATDLLAQRDKDDAPKATAVAELWFALEPKAGTAANKRSEWRDGVIEAMGAATKAKEHALAKRLNALAARHAPLGDTDAHEAAAITMPWDAIPALLAADKADQVIGPTKLRRIIDVLAAQGAYSSRSAGRTIESLKDAAESARFVAALRKVPVSLRALSSLAFAAVELLAEKKNIARAVPVAQLLVDLEPKETCKRGDKHAAWLSNLNNAICRAVAAKQRDLAIDLSAIAMRHAGANDNLPHNAATGLVLAKRYEDAVAMCRVAIENRYKDVKKLATDKDLAPLRSRNDFKALFAKKR